LRESKGDLVFFFFPLFELKCPPKSFVVFEDPVPILAYSSYVYYFETVEVAEDVEEDFGGQISDTGVGHHDVGRHVEFLEDRSGERGWKEREVEETIQAFS